MAQCRVCKKCFTYNDEVGYDRELCGPICDGVESGRRQMISHGVILAAFCAGLSCRDDVPIGVRQEAIKLANEFKREAGIQ
jgi:hypothetical protein